VNRLLLEQHHGAGHGAAPDRRHQNNRQRERHVEAARGEQQERAEGLPPATISDTTTPMTASVTEIFMPAKIDVSDHGNSTLMNSCHQLHDSDVA